MTVAENLEALKPAFMKTLKELIKMCIRDSLDTSRTLTIIHRITTKEGISWTEH